MLLPLVTALLSLAVAALGVKLLLLRRELRQIGAAFEDRLCSDTNAPIFVSTGDRAARELAAALNRGLASLRAQRLRYERGDRELRANLAGVSHDLRTPLTAILGYLELLDREPLSENARRYAAVLRERAELMRTLTGELFTWSVARSPERTLSPETLSVNGVLEECLASFYTELTARNIAPEVSMPASPVIRRADRAALSRIFTNLLSNAVKYSAGDLRIVLTPAGAVSFSNAAPGITEAELSRLFDRFYTVNTAVPSTGLGLSVAKSLAGALGARLTLDCADGRLTATLTLLLRQLNN